MEPPKKPTPKRIKKTVTKTAHNAQFDPNKHLYWSTKRIILTAIICTIFSILVVFGFLASSQYRKSQIADSPKTDKHSASGSKHYTNNYWGIEFDYPGTWTQPIGSYADGEYYFTSQPANFINELEPGEAIIALKTFNNWNNLALADWMKSQQWTFLPPGQLSAPKATSVGGMPAQRYMVTLKTPQNNTTLWDMIIISRSTATKYVFILETDGSTTHDKYLPTFESLLSSVTYRKVESNPSGN